MFSCCASFTCCSATMRRNTVTHSLLRSPTNTCTKHRHNTECDNLTLLSHLQTRSEDVHGKCTCLSRRAQFLFKRQRVVFTLLGECVTLVSQSLDFLLQTGVRLRAESIGHTTSILNSSLILVHVGTRNVHVYTPTYLPS